MLVKGAFADGFTTNGTKHEITYAAILGLELLSPPSKETPGILSETILNITGLEFLFSMTFRSTKKSIQ